MQIKIVIRSLAFLAFSLLILFFISTPAFACTVTINPTSAMSNTDTNVTFSLHNTDGDFYNGFILTATNPTISNIICSGNLMCSDSNYTYGIDSTTTYHVYDDGGSINNVIFPGETFDGFGFKFNGNLPTTFTVTPQKDHNAYASCTMDLMSGGGITLTPTPTPSPTPSPTPTSQQMVLG